MIKQKYVFTIKVDENNRVFTRRKITKGHDAYLMLTYLQIEVDNLLDEIKKYVKKNKDKK